MTKNVSIDIEKLVSDKIEKGVIGSTLCLENRKLGDEGVSKLSNLDILSEVICLELGENEISDKGLKILCNSPHIKNLKTLNLKSNNIEPDTQLRVPVSTEQAKLK